ncbi:YihD family protein [Orbus mooreae]|uniref:YihD family protein n=1 Tax=Orbus mooreae TaxID=3074107 RepID=UPI00370D588D
MACHRIEELIELLEPAWDKEQDLSLLQFLQKLGTEAGFNGELNELSDEILIYHLKMRNSDKCEAIPGIKKDYEDDFKTALLKARGIIK